MRSLNLVIRLVERMSYGLAAATGVTVLVLFCMVIFIVGARTLLGKSSIALFDLTQLLLFMVFFLPVALIARRGGHVAIEFVTVRLSGRCRYTARLAALVLPLIFAVLIMWRGWDAIWSLRASGTATIGAALPLYPWAIVIFLGGLVYSLQMVILILREIGANRRSKSTSQG